MNGKIANIFDSHFHIIDHRFPLVENQGFIPSNFTVQDYLVRTQKLNIIGGVIVSGSFQAFDQNYLIDALKTLGPNYVGVIQLSFDTSNEDIIRLNEIGVRAIRFNIKRGGSERLNQLEYLAKRVYELVGWHVELYIDSRFLSELSYTLRQLPAVSIDHLGLSKDGFPTLLSLVEHGVKVKATGFGRVDFDVKEALRSILSVNPYSLMFGTDLPSTRAEIPFQDSDIEIVSSILDEELAKKVFYQNAIEWYKPIAF